MRKTLLLLTMILVQTVTTSAQRKEVLLETTEGNIRIALYDETPIHRDNFVKLVKEQTYDSLLFHRVIRDFMIQAGDLKSTVYPSCSTSEVPFAQLARATGPIPNNVLAPVSSILSGANVTATWLSARCKNG